MHNIITTENILLIGALLLFVAVMAGKAAYRFGAPALLFFLGVGYETHLRNLGDSDWKLRHRYHISATANFRYQWLKVSLRERFQQTFDRGDSETRLRSRLKLSYAPTKGIVSPYFSVEIYQSLDDTSFWRADRMRYRPGVEIALAKRWSLDAFYCYQYASSQGSHMPMLSWIL
mgnify:CR=1 FL=1